MTKTIQLQFGPYSPVRQAENMYFVSGQVGVDAHKKAPEDVVGQARQALENMKTVLESADLTMDNVTKTTIFLKDIDDFAAVNDVYVEYFPEPRPARSCVQVAALPKVADNELLVEIEAVACKVHDS